LICSDVSTGSLYDGLDPVQKLSGLTTMRLIGQPVQIITMRTAT
jgi:hypothetical protein